MKNKRESIIFKQPLTKECIFIEFIIISLIILIFIFPLNLNKENYIKPILIAILLIYFFSVFLLRLIIFYRDSLVIFYPTRPFFRKRKIEYSQIKKIKYIWGENAYSLPEVNIFFHNSKIPHFYISRSLKKRTEVLKKLNELDLKIEIKSVNPKDKFLLKEIQKQ